MSQSFVEELGPQKGMPVYLCELLRRQISALPPLN